MIVFCHMISDYKFFSYWGSSRSGEEKLPGLPGACITLTFKVDT